VGTHSQEGENDEPGWFVVDSSASPFTNYEQQQADEVVEETKAWDGTPLERMELDEVVLGLSSSSPSSNPSSSSPLSSSSPRSNTNNSNSENKSSAASPSSPSARIVPSYLTLPPNPASESSEGGANDTFVRLDLELEVGVRRREVAIVGREEVGRMMMKSGSGGLSGGLPGAWVN